MVATLGLPLVHVTIRPVSVPPADSFGVAVSCTVCPTVRLVVAGEIATEATGTVVTVSAAVLLLPSLVAVIVAEPAVTPATRPLPLMVATLGLPLVHVTIRPVSVPPADSFGVAVSCTVCPTVRLVVAGEIATEATGTVVTVSAAVLLLPSLVAVIVAEPAVTPATRPLPLMVATLGLPLVHVTIRPVSVPPADSFGVAVSCTVCPTVRLVVAGEIATEATGTVVTVSAAVLLLPSLVAVIVAEPAVTPATRPLPLMVATLGLPLVHVTIRPVSVPPADSFGVAVSCTVCPTVRLVVAGEIATEATGTVVTVSAAVLLLPSLVAVIVAEPAVTPATRPLPLMVATLGLPLVHVTIRPVSVPPAESFGVAVSCTVCPTVRLVVAGEIATEATGTVVTVSAAVLLLPSLVAVIVAEPAVTPATRPLPLMVATLGLPLVHVTIRPVSVPPAESFGVAVSCNV